MLVVLSIVLLLVVGIILSNISNDSCNETWGPFTIIITVVGLVSCFILIMGVPVDTYRFVRKYEQHKIFYDECIKNKNLSGEERSSLIIFVMDDNSDIICARTYIKNPFTNWFVSKKISNLELFDISKIPTAVYDVDSKKSVE